MLQTSAPRNQFDSKMYLTKMLLQPEMSGKDSSFQKYATDEKRLTNKKRSTYKKHSTHEKH